MYSNNTLHSCQVPNAYADLTTIVGEQFYDIYSPSRLAIDLVGSHLEPCILESLALLGLRILTFTCRLLLLRAEEGS